MKRSFLLFTFVFIFGGSSLAALSSIKEFRQEALPNLNPYFISASLKTGTLRLEPSSVWLKIKSHIQKKKIIKKAFKAWRKLKKNADTMVVGDSLEGELWDWRAGKPGRRLRWGGRSSALAAAPVEDRFFTTYSGSALINGGQVNLIYNQTLGAYLFNRRWSGLLNVGVPVSSDAMALMVGGGLRRHIAFGKSANINFGGQVDYNLAMNFSTALTASLWTSSALVGLGFETGKHSNLDFSVKIAGKKTSIFAGLTRGF